MSILNIRGTHGSGKSWVVHQLLQEGSDDLKDGSHKLIGHYVEKYDCGVVGRYSRVCGGCDGIKTAVEVVDRVARFSQRFKHVVFEGILVSHTFQRYSDLATTLKDLDFWFLFLDTPLAQCIARVKARRLERGNTKPFDPKNVIKDYHCIWEKVRNKCLSAQHQVQVLDWTNPLPQVLKFLEA